MGQYYHIINLDKKQFLHPHKFADGLKLLEFGASGNGTMCGLAILLASGNNRGGGDLRSDNPIIGSWAGDRIVIAGDYDDEEKFGTPPGTTLYSLCGDEGGEDGRKAEYEDISERVIIAMADDSYLRDDLKKALLEGWMSDRIDPAVRAALEAE